MSSDLPADSLNPPARAAGDTAHSLVRAVISAVPLLGGPATELFQFVVQPPLERRRAEWMSRVGEKLRELEASGLDLTALGSNPEFISAVMHASQLALRTHQEEKLEALRNALTNIAVGQSPSDALQHMYFGWIDSLSVLHLRVLKLFQLPPTPPHMSIGSLGNVLEYNFPELREHRPLYNQVWSDLLSRGLVTADLNITMTENGLGQKRTTEMADLFLDFIAPPANAV